MKFLLLGESGLGKSTLLNSLFLTDIYTPAGYPSIEERLKKTVSVSTLCYRYSVQGKSFSLLLDIVIVRGL